MHGRRNRFWSALGRCLAVSLAAVLLASCGGGSSSGSGGDQAPQISGSPTTTVQAGTDYAFSPGASDADGDLLSFQISGKPDWASFDTGSGALTGTPTNAQIGSYANIIIKVSDGSASTALAPFAIAVTQISTGAATLSWAPPSENSDGTPLTNLAGYHIYYGTSAGAPSLAVDVPGVGITTYVVTNLAPATWYFTVRDYTSTGAESGPSTIVSKTIQ